MAAVKLPPRHRAASPRRREGLAALLLYAACSLVLFGIPVLSDLSGRVVGWGVDPASHVWFLAWCRVAGDLSPRRFVLLLTAVLIGQFLISTEVALTLALFGGLTLVLAVALARDGARALVVRTTWQVGAAYLLSALPLAPYLY